MSEAKLTTSKRWISARLWNELVQVLMLTVVITAGIISQAAYLT